MSEIDSILKAEKEKKLIVGFKEVLTALKLGQAREVFVTRTCPPVLKKQLGEAAKLSGSKLIDLNLSGEELSAQLKKPFNITIAAITNSK